MSNGPWTSTSSSGSSSAPSTTALGTAASVAAVLVTLGRIASDGWLTSGEKPEAIKDWNDLNGSQADLVAKALAVSVSSTAFTTAMTTLSSYLTGLSPAWNDTTQDTAITAATWNTDWANACNERLKLLNAITAAAQATANGATTGVNQINSVDYLTNSDKIQLMNDWNNEAQLKPQLDAQASALGVSSTAYDNAVAALSTSIIAAGAPSNWATIWPDGTSWNSTSIMTNLKTWWGSIATNRATLQKACGDKIQSNAAYSDALARSSYNLIKNGNSEDTNATGTEAAGVSTGYPYSGTRCRKVVTVGAGNTWMYVTPTIPVSEGEEIYFEAMTGADSPASRLVAIDWFNAAGSWIAGSYGTTRASDGDLFLAPSVCYKKQSVSGVAPSGACGFRAVLGAYVASASVVTTSFDNMYACRKVAAGFLQGDAIQTTNYAETSGNPTAGARMDISGTALKVASSNFQMGAVIFSDYFWGRLNQALDGSGAGGRVIYRGNVDTTTRSGAPNIACLSVGRRRWDTTNKIGRLELKIQPSASGGTDNLDAMRFAGIQLFRQSAAGTTATLTAVDTYYQPIKDRLYYSFGTDTNTSNAVYVTFETNDSLISSGFPAAIVQLFNAYGPSDANCFYAAAGNTDGSALTNNGTTWPSGITGASGGGSGGGGGGGGGGCPAPWVQIQLASGLLVDAADLYDGAQVAGVNDTTLEPMVGIVRCPMTIWADRVPIHLEDGTVTEFSTAHRFMVEGKGWLEARQLVPGDSILAQQPSIVRSVGKPIKAQVVTFSVDGSHTYFADGLLSHNLKILS